MSPLRLEIESWAFSDHLGLPRSIDFLDDAEEFAELLASNCEEHHLDAMMHNAFVATHEANAELRANESIDAVHSPEDQGDDFDAIKQADAEAELLETNAVIRQST